MLKPLTFSVSLAVALGACSLGYAGGHHKSLPSAQGIAPSAQGILPSPQGEVCGDICGPRKRCHLFDMFKHREKCYTYEWVLKKKRCGGLFGHRGHGGCGGDVCGGCGEVYPSAQWPSAQGGVYGTGQAEVYGAGQMGGAYGAGQMGTGQMGGPAGTVTPSSGDNVGPAPEAAPNTANPPGDETASNGSLLFLAPAGN
jgi:hypothetical protein